MTRKGGIRTATLAELYARQGHLDQAAEIYEELLSERPDDADLQARLERVRTGLALRHMDAGRRDRVEHLRTLLSRVHSRRRSA